MNRYLILFLLLLTQCKGQEKNDDIIIVVQPVMEKDATNSIKILFKNLTLKDSIFIGEHEEIDLNDNPSKREIEIIGENYLEYYTYIIPTKKGIFKLPEIKGISKSKTIISKPKTIEIVNKIPIITSKNIILKLTSDKEKYSINDTIKIELYEYRQFYNVSKITLKKDSIMSLPKIKAVKSGLAIEKESDLYRISGIENLESYVEERFNILNFDWDPFGTGSIMAKINGDSYIKTLLFSVNIKAKQRGKFKIDPSKFKYVVFKSESDFSDSFVKNEKGTYNVKTSGNKILIVSKELSFEVK